MSELLRPLSFADEVALALDNPLALYKDGQLVAVGSVDDLCKASGLTPKTLYNYTREHFIKRNKGKIEIIRIEEPEYDVKKLGKNLRRIRKRIGLTLGEAEKLAGIHQTTISSYERGISRPSLKKLKLLAAAYQVSLAELVY